MVKKVTKPKVSADEKKYRKNLFPEVSSVQNKNILCTSCNTSVKELVLRGKPIAHRFLETLLCEKCDEFFGDGEFSVDEDGSDKYCRWCGQGGTLYLCSTCTAGFCKKCIKRNLPRSALNEVEDDNWKCYCCDVKPLYDLRALCWAAQNYAAEKVKVTDNSRKKKQKRRSSSDDEREENSNLPEKKRRNMRQSKEKKSQNTLEKPMKKHIQVGALKMSEFLSDTVSLVEIVKKKGLEYKNKKTAAKSLNSVDSIISCANKVDSVLELVENSTRKIRENLSNYIEAWKRVIEEGETLSSEISKDDDENMVQDSDNDNERDSKSDDDADNEREKRMEKDSEAEENSGDKGEDQESEDESKERSSGHESDDETKSKKSIEHESEEESKDRGSNGSEPESKGNDHDNDHSKVGDSDNATEHDEDIDTKGSSKQRKNKGAMDNGDTNNYRGSANDEET